MKEKKDDIMHAVREALAKSDLYFSKPTLENGQPVKVVTMADIDAREAQLTQEQKTNLESH